MDTNQEVHPDGGGGILRAVDAGKRYPLGREECRNERSTFNSATLVHRTLRADQDVT